jgi:hypothetical protein
MAACRLGETSSDRRRAPAPGLENWGAWGQTDEVTSTHVRPIAVEHRATVQELEEGCVQATCSCGWRSPVFGADKKTGTMDPLQQAMDACDLHQWDASL